MRYPKNSRFMGIGDGFAKQNAAVKQRNPQNLHKNEIFLLPPINLYTTIKNPTYEDHANVLS
jgi:hypothetical protein